jgi:hypothetical protein
VYRTGSVIPILRAGDMRQPASIWSASAFVGHACKVRHRPQPAVGKGEPTLVERSTSEQYAVRGPLGKTAEAVSLGASGKAGSCCGGTSRRSHVFPVEAGLWSGPTPDHPITGGALQTHRRSKTGALPAQ